VEEVVGVEGVVAVEAAGKECPKTANFVVVAQKFYFTVLRYGSAEFSSTPRTSLVLNILDKTF
jgi:hypothetical protein